MQTTNFKKAFKVETKDIYRKCKKAANMPLATKPIICPSSNLPPPSGFLSSRKLEKYNLVQFSAGSMRRVSAD
jgi:hypothetical protein